MCVLICYLFRLPLINSFQHFAPGSCDGEVRVWDLARQSCTLAVPAHSGFVRGLCMNHDGSRFVTVGEDKIVRQWAYPDSSLSSPSSEYLDQDNIEPITSVVGKSVLLGVDHHHSEPYFATCGEHVAIWDETRSDPLQTFTWGVDSITNVRYNPIERNMIVTTGSDRAVTLYDVRQSTPLRKVILSMKSNGAAWNPMEAYNFTVANEDSNLYTFDMRRLDHPLNVHMDHIMAVLDVDYAPTGTEFVSGSYDKTVRIFGANSGRSREVYHTKRMQRIFCVRWSSDSTYLLSGSDEMNIRLWKAEASKKIGTLRAREKTALNYSAKLRHQYRFHPVIKRIARHRHIPKMIYKAQKEKQVILVSQKRKRENVIRHSKKGSVTIKAQRQKSVVEVVK